MKELGKYLVSGIGSLLVLWSLQIMRTDFIEAKKQFINEQKFNELLSKRLKEIKVDENGRLIAAP